MGTARLAWQQRFWPTASSVSLDSVVSAAALGLVGVLVILPLLFLLYAAFSTGSPGQPGALVTLEHVRTVYFSTKYVGPLLNSLYLAVVVTVLVVPVGTLFAWLIARTDIPQRRLIESLMVLPIFISPLLGALAWVALAAPGSGFINAFARTFGLAARDLIDIYSFSGIVFVMFLYFVPFAYLFVVGALKNMDPALEDAVHTIGGGDLAAIRHVTLPMLVPAVFSSALLVFVLATEHFAVPAMLGVRMGEFTTITMLIYQGFLFQNVPQGEVAALGTLLLWLTLAGIFFYRRTVAIARRYVTVSGKGYQPRLIVLGKWRYAALALLALYAAAAVVLPYVALVLASLLRFLTPRLRLELFTLDNYAQLVQPSALLAIQNTLLLGIAGATITAVLAFFVSYLIVRGRGRVTAAIDYISTLPVAIPSMAMAIGLLWTYTLLPLPVYGTLAVLLIAYVTRFLVYGVRIGTAGLHQIDPELEEAGRIAGLSRLATFWRIALPLLRPSLLAAWILLFVLIVVEISATILLYTANTTTMSVAIWLAVETSGSVRAFTMGALQITLVFIVISLAHRMTGSLQRVLA